MLTCFKDISADGVVNKAAFLKWAATGDENFVRLRKHLEGVDKKATKALLNLYSKVAVSLSQTKSQKEPSVAANGGAATTIEGRVGDGRG